MKKNTFYYESEWIHKLETKEHWNSYWIQQKLIEEFVHKDENLLEIGVGSGFCSNYLKSRGFSITTLDIDKDKKPIRKTGKYFSPEKRKYRIKKEKKSINLIPIIKLAIVILLIISAFFLFNNLLDRTKDVPISTEKDIITEEENNLTEEKSLEEELTEMAEKNIEKIEEDSTVKLNSNYLEPLPEYKTINVIAQEPAWIKVIQNDKILFESLILANENINIHTEGTVSLLSTSSDKLTVYYEDEEITPKTTDIASLLTYQIIPHNENN